MVETENKNVDVLIIGSGPAGLTAAIYSAWLGLKTVVLESGIVGGRAWLAPKIENFPGFEFGIKGNDLAEKMRLQALRFHAEILEAEEVVGLDLTGECKRVVSRKQTYGASALIIATGTQRRKLLVAGETDFVGRGVSYCVTCDGPLFKNATVAVVGNGEEAAIDALFMADLASQVLLVSEQQELNIEGTLMDRLKNKLNIEIIKGQVLKIVGEQVVNALRILEFDSRREVERTVKGIFVSLGGVPMTTIIKNAGVATDPTGCLIVDRQQKTSVEGVFAAGDCTCGGMQVVTAAGEGAMAAMRASAYVRKVKT
ncbi:MAG: FAD-dependent oxidoreductase [Candidatus Bathyarchaeia archaeon]|jgi:thioredoxin reductase (NADPH)